MAKTELTNPLVATGAAFGVAGAFAPRMLARVYGLNREGDVLASLQLFGTRNLALAGLAATASDDEARDAIVTAVGAACLADTVLVAINGLRRRVSARTALTASLTTSAFAALCAYYVKG